MRNLYIIILFLFSFSIENISGQTITNEDKTDIDMEAVMLKSSGDIKKGEQVRFVSLSHNISQDNYGNMDEQYFLIDSKNRKVEINGKMEKVLDFHIKSVQNIWDVEIITKVLPILRKKGMQYDLRREMEEEALDYIGDIKKYDNEFNDPYLESYIYSLISNIAPSVLIDGRPTNLNILIVKNPTINAGTFPNGTIVLNTGLLAALHSEDELVAILSHEIAHYVLDHSIQNINKEVSRKKRAEFWAALATGLTAAAETVAAVKNDYYQPGLATLGVAVLSSQIAEQVSNRLGMEYNHEQEYETDALALSILQKLGYDKNALATSLNRIESYYLKERNHVMYFNSYTHPALAERISKAGMPQKTVNSDFEKMISFVLTDVGTMHFITKRFKNCLQCVTENIKNRVATSDDYLLAASCMLYLKNTDESNHQVLEMITKAKQIDPNNINIYKNEIIAMLRLNDKVKAIQLLDEYQDKLVGMSDLSLIKNEQVWEYNYNFVSQEKDWVRRMLLKLKGM